MYAVREDQENIYKRIMKVTQVFPEMRDINWGIVSGFEDRRFYDRWNTYVATMTTSTLSNAPLKATQLWEDLEGRYEID